MGVGRVKKLYIDICIHADIYRDLIQGATIMNRLTFLGPIKIRRGGLLGTRCHNVEIDNTNLILSIMFD